MAFSLIHSLIHCRRIKENKFVIKVYSGREEEDVQSEGVFTYSKLAQAGIAAISYLATVYGEDRWCGSAEIAESRELSRQLVAKILTMLSRAGLVEGSPGPAGGYRLCREPAEITLLDVVEVFEDLENRVMCPFGPHWCGHGPHCPLHHTLFDMHKKVIERLSAETFAQFVPKG